MLFIFWKFDYNVSQCGSLWVDPGGHLGICLASWTFIFMFLIKFGEFSAIISSNMSFKYILCPFLFAETSRTHTFVCLWCPTGPLGSAHFSGFFFPFYSSASIISIDHWFNSPESALSPRERGLQHLRGGGGSAISMAVHLFAPLLSKRQLVIRAHIPNIWEMGSFPHLSSDKLYARCSHGWRWGMGGCVKSWSWPKLTIIFYQSLPLKVASLNRLQSSKIVISDKFWQCDC